MAEMEVGSERRKLKNPMRLLLSKNSLQCEVCGYEASSAACLKIHVRVHTGEKPYRCDECNYASAKKCNLTRHRERHSNARVECEVCCSQIKTSFIREHRRLLHGYTIEDECGDVESGGSDNLERQQLPNLAGDLERSSENPNSLYKDEDDIRDNAKVSQTRRLDLNLLCSTVLAFLQSHALTCTHCGPVLQCQAHIKTREQTASSENETISKSPEIVESEMTPQSELYSHQQTNDMQISADSQVSSDDIYQRVDNSSTVPEKQQIIHPRQVSEKSSATFDMNKSDEYSTYFYHDRVDQKRPRTQVCHTTHETKYDESSRSSESTKRRRKESDGFDREGADENDTVQTDGGSAEEKIQTKPVYVKCEMATTEHHDFDSFGSEHNVDGSRSIINESVLSSADLKDETKTSYRCDLCSYCVISETDLVEHYKWHRTSSDELHLCSFCSYSTHSSDELQSHITTAHNIEVDDDTLENRRDHECLFCGKMFQSTSDLKEHSKRTHKGQKLQCNKCGYTSDRYSNMKRHRESHIGQFDKMVKCGLCHAVFSNKSGLGAHERTHSDVLDKPARYRCATCGKKFRREIDHTFHVLVHLENKMFQCPELGCVRESNSIAYLKRHYWQEHS